MTAPFKSVDNGKRYELISPTAMPNASSFLWNKNMLLQVNCRGYVIAQHMQPEPSKYSHAPILEHKTFMQPEQPFYAHHPGRFAYIRDNNTQTVFSAPYEPCRRPLDKFVFSVGQHDIEWRVQKNDINICMSLTLPLDDVAELWSISVENTSNSDQDLSLFPCFTIGYMSWMNQSAEYSEQLGAVVAKSITPYQKVEDYAHIKTLKDITVLMHDSAPTAWDTRRDAFEGEGGVHAPDGIFNRTLSNSDAIYETPIAALQYDLILKANEKKTFRFVFAPVHNLDDARALKEKFLNNNGFERNKEKVDAFFKDNKRDIHIETPDAELDDFVNQWLGRQVFYHGDTNRLTTDPQTRNYLQDAMGMAYIQPQQTRAAILRTLSQQKPDGALPEGVVLPRGKELKYINQVPHTDHSIWLPIVLEAYLNETADYDFLALEIQDTSGTKRALHDRVTLAMRWLINNRDARGLSLIAQGDWCDPLNMVGYLGKGVSGWLTIASVYSLNIWAKISETTDALAIATEMRDAAQAFTDATQAHLWDGNWFARGISDNGTAFGISDDEEGKIWLNPQSWALLGEVTTQEQQEKILSAIREHIDTPYGPVVLAPAYTCMQEHIGRVTQKQPGSGENGAVYNHAGMFYVSALYKINESSLAFEQLKKIVPNASDDTYLTRGQLPVFVPNYYRGAVKQLPRTAGRSSQLFNTGACSWLYRIIIEQLFGLKGQKEGLSISPQLPSHWSEASVKRHFRGANVEINIKRDKTSKNLSLSVNGQQQVDHVITNIESGQHYVVDVRIPEVTK